MFSSTFALFFYKCLQLCRYLHPGHKLDPVSCVSCQSLIITPFGWTGVTIHDKLKNRILSILHIFLMKKREMGLNYNQQDTYQILWQQVLCRLRRCAEVLVGHSKSTVYKQLFYACTSKVMNRDESGNLQTQVALANLYVKEPDGVRTS